MIHCSQFVNTSDFESFFSEVEVIYLSMLLWPAPNQRYRKVICNERLLECTHADKGVTT